MLDQMVHECTVRRKTNGWPIAFFQNIIDVVVIASLIIWENINPDWNARKKNLENYFYVKSQPSW